MVGGSRRPLALPSRLRRVPGERFLEPADHRRFDRRGRRAHKLAHFLELGHDGLALYTELLREFVNPDLRHHAPLLGPRGGPSTGSSADPGQGVLRVGVSSRCSSPCAHRALIASRPAFHTGFRGVQFACPWPRSRRHSVRVRRRLDMLIPGCPSVKGTKTTGPRRVDPAREERAGTPCGAAPVRSMPVWDAGRHPGPAAALGGQARYRPRPPRGEASWTLPPVPYTQHRCVPDTFPAAAVVSAQIVRSFQMKVYRVATPGGTRRP